MLGAVENSSSGPRRCARSLPLGFQSDAAMLALAGVVAHQFPAGWAAHVCLWRWGRFTRVAGLHDGVDEV